MNFFNINNFLFYSYNYFKGILYVPIEIIIIDVIVIILISIIIIMICYYYL
jgi:hypothetical protein